MLRQAKHDTKEESPQPPLQGGEKTFPHLYIFHPRAQQSFMSAGSSVMEVIMQLPTPSVSTSPTLYTP